MSNPQAGFGLVEAVVSMFVLTLVVGMTFDMLTSSSGSSKQGSAMAKLDTEAARTMDRIVKELAPAGLSTLVPANPVGSSTLTFQQCTGYAAGAQQWSALRRIAFVPSTSAADTRGEITWGGAAAGSKPIVWLDGVAPHLEGELANGHDDNGNGAVDESGLCFTLSGRLLTVSLTVQGPATAGRALSRTLTTSVFLRN